MTETKTPMTDSEYVENSGMLCPYCGSEDISAGDCGIDGLLVSIDVECHDCEKEWLDIYALAGYQHDN